MKFVEELVVEEFLPTFRSMLAERLRERDLTQSEVASILGISQSAVSKYAHGEVARNEAVLNDERVRDLVDELADGLATGDLTPVGALVEVEVLIRELERGDLLARLHEERVPGLAENSGYDVHDPEGALRAAERTRSSVRRGLRTLENTSGFAGLIPNVGSNLVECTPDADGIDDVAGVPGRIFDVKGRTTVPGEPEFGVSGHVASVLLAARAHGSDARAALNLRYDDALHDQLASLGLETVEFDGETDTESAIASVAVAEADVLYQTGAMGIEPITYLLAPDAETAAERVRDLV
ncbi:thiamine-phosphate synthase family protein [Halococcus saccharolyticus]|uniref:Phosphomethylpyrimidine kinase n=1 Tax=Halococcus saccharolyticus DSM 5350 TaxID=1227455 RepID=M0MQH0_9EURY|nr:thiamine-phosphate synthase family protein [Halococcus saccharolyticus]EMA46725.1 phosphomethylpyrimidine kinase [Halococcus saccharolyticus DSM 5350]